MSGILGMTPAIRYQFWRRVDDVAHFLYEPTALGSRCHITRWHHRLHLIPGALLWRVCDHYDSTLT